MIDSLSSDSPAVGPMGLMGRKLRTQDGAMADTGVDPSAQANGDVPASRAGSYEVPLELGSSRRPTGARFSVRTRRQQWRSAQSSAAGSVESARQSTSDMLGRPA